ncbi:MAG: LysR family transcriptional regulator [Candidatus Fimivivens sp.]
MNFLNLRYFVVVAEELNFSRAAKRLFISQQSLSNHIKKLEEEYGVLLFQRNHRITLTEAGQSLYRNAKEMLDMQNRAEKELLDIKNFRQGRISLGIAPSRGLVMLPPLLTEYHRRFPQVRIRVYEGDNTQIQERLISGKIDIAIGFEFDDETIASDLLFREQQYIVIPKTIFKACFTSEQQERMLLSEIISPALLAECPFVSANSSSWTDQIFRKMTEKYGFSPNVILRTYNTFTMLALCRAGLGVSICSKTFLWNDLKKNHTPDRELYCFLPDDELAANRIVISSKRGSYRTRAVKELINVAKSIFAE